MLHRFLRYTGRTIALLWALLWIFFGAASGFGAGESLGGIFVHTLMPGMVFLISALVAWKWDVLGGILLMAEGLAVLVRYPFMARGFPSETIVFVLLTMVLPPLAAGGLLLLGRRRSDPEMTTSQFRG
ncbi:MAG TPA: hypothetical protein VGL38_07070 [bacterium]|jgi:hypothetical protein